MTRPKGKCIEEQKKEEKKHIGINVSCLGHVE